MTSPFDARPIIVALAGPNGAGKTTFFGSHLVRAGLRFVNADGIARELEIDAYEAARVAGNIREALLEQRESFVFETVFSDPVGEKVGFLQRAAAAGFTVVLCFIGVASAAMSDEPYPRTMANLRAAIGALPHVLVFDNGDLARPFRKVAEFRDGEPLEVNEPLPGWVPWP